MGNGVSSLRESDPYAVTGLCVPCIGWAVLAWQAPHALARQELLESPTAAAKLVKLLVFGQSEHVRCCLVGLLPVALCM